MGNWLQEERKRARRAALHVRNASAGNPKQARTLPNLRHEIDADQETSRDFDKCKRGELD